MVRPVVKNLSECYDSLRHLLHELTDAEWQVPSLCPAWRVHGVVAHVTAVETLLAGWAPALEPALFDPSDALPEYMAEAATWPPAQMFDRFQAAVAARRAELAEMDADDFETRCWTPVGPQTYERFMEVRVFDLWVHEQDIRVPLGRPGHLEGPAAEMALAQVTTSFGFIAGKLVGVPEGRGVAVHLTGPLGGDVAARVVDGRARPVEHLAAPDAEITTDSLTFVLLACGRIDPQAALAEGRVTTAGDPGLAHALATRLRFTP